MTTLDEHNSEDYVLVHKSKAKISRARKLVIGTMMVGAVAAIAGAGTFASFSASTTNEASFSTARMALRNGGNGGCVTPAGRTGTATANAAVDTNEVADSTSATSTTDCPTLFPDPLKPGDTATSTVTVENVGDVDAALYLFSEAACNVTVNLATYDMGTATNLCDRVVMSVQRTSGTPACVFGAGGGTCTALDQSTPDSGGSSQSFTGFSSKLFANKITAAPSIVHGGAAQTFTVSVYWKKTTGTTDCQAVLGGGNVDVDTPGDPGTPDGFVDSTGRGCDNPYMNQKAHLNMRWQIQG